MQENPQKIDPDSGLPFCVFHNDRVEHFYCEAHKVTPRLFRPLAAGSALRSGIPSRTAKSSTSITFQTPRSTSILSRPGLMREIFPSPWLITTGTGRRGLATTCLTSTTTTTMRIWWTTVTTRSKSEIVFDCVSDGKSLMMGISGGGGGVATSVNI
jgi:hypothetical protein